MTTKDIGQWLKGGEYLPPFMRDFHAQKLLFKRIDRVVETRKKLNEQEDKIHLPIEYPNWMDAQIYVIDIFLWFMASRGYTLQRTRKQVGTIDLAEDLKQYEDEQRKAFANMLKERAA